MLFPWWYLLPYRKHTCKPKSYHIGQRQNSPLKIELDAMVTRIRHRSGRRRQLYLKEWRNRAKLTQQQLADRLDTTKATISRYENRKREPDVGYLEALADALDREPQDFYRHPDTPSPEELLRGVSDDQRMKIVRALKEIVSASETTGRTGTTG